MACLSFHKTLLVEVFDVLFTGGHLQVSLVDIEEATVLYTKHIASDICPGIISLQSETCSVQGFEKNVLVVAMRDSSVFALDSDTGNMMGTTMIKPKKPFKALFMQILGRSLVHLCL